MNARDEQGATPLIYAAILEKTSMAKTLCEFGADLEARDAEGYTALMRACFPLPQESQGSNERANPVHHILLQKGANKFATPQITELQQVRYWLNAYKDVYGHVAFRLKSGELYEGYMEVDEDRNVIVFFDPWSFDDDPEIPFDEIDVSTLYW